MDCGRLTLYWSLWAGPTRPNWLLPSRSVLHPSSAWPLGCAQAQLLRLLKCSGVNFSRAVDASTLLEVGAWTLVTWGERESCCTIELALRDSDHKGTPVFGSLGGTRERLRRNA